MDHETLKQFLFEHVEDVVELEIIACFQQRHEEVPLTAAEVTAMTRLPAASIQEALERLAARGLLLPTAVEPAAYRCDVADAMLRQVLSLVIAEYRANPVQVMGLMTANAIERVRTAAIISFAECFRIRRRKSNG